MSPHSNAAAVQLRITQGGVGGGVRILCANQGGGMQVGLLAHQTGGPQATSLEWSEPPFFSAMDPLTKTELVRFLSECIRSFSAVNAAQNEIAQNRFNITRDEVLQATEHARLAVEARRSASAASHLPEPKGLLVWWCEQLFGMLCPCMCKEGVKTPRTPTPPPDFGGIKAARYSSDPYAREVSAAEAPAQRAQSAADAEADAEAARKAEMKARAREKAQARVAAKKAQRESQSQPAQGKLF